MDELDRRDIAIFGENMTAVHSIRYSGLRSYFYVFGCLNRTRGRWLSWRRVEYIANELGLPTVPVLFGGPIRFESASELSGRLRLAVRTRSMLSLRDDPVLPEGFVVRKSAGFETSRFDRCVAKYVRKNHNQIKLERHRAMGDWKKATIADDDTDDESDGDMPTDAKSIGP